MFTCVFIRLKKWVRKWVKEGFKFDRTINLIRNVKIDDILNFLLYMPIYVGNQKKYKTMNNNQNSISFNNITRFDHNKTYIINIGSEHRRFKIHRYKQTLTITDSTRKTLTFKGRILINPRKNIEVFPFQIGPVKYLLEADNFSSRKRAA